MVRGRAFLLESGFVCQKIGVKKSTSFGSLTSYWNQRSARPLESKELMLSLTALIVLAFAAFRITRFIVFDAILNEPRKVLYNLLSIKKKRGSGELIIRGGYINRKLSQLSTCTWCVGFWVSALVYYIHIRDFNLINICAVAGVQSLLHTLDPVAPMGT